ncbi:MAG: hypothetical protein WAQ28_05470 [Bacteroidia bacterium]
MDKDTKVYSNEPGDVRDVSVNLLPISFRTGVGIRYFFYGWCGYKR